MNKIAILILLLSAAFCCNISIEASELSLSRQKEETKCMPESETIQNNKVKHLSDSLETEYEMYRQAIEWLRKHNKDQKIFIDRFTEMLDKWFFFEYYVEDEKTLQFVKEGTFEFLKADGVLDNPTDLREIWKPEMDCKYTNVATFSNVHHNMVIADLYPFDRKVGILGDDEGDEYVYSYLFIFDEDHKLKQTYISKQIVE